MNTMMFSGIVILLSVSMGGFNASHATLYQWKDQTGVSHYSDAPPEHGHATVRKEDAPCELKRQVDERDNLALVIILGTYLGGLDDSNRILAGKRWNDNYRSLVVALHDLEEYCKGGDQLACACLSSIHGSR